MSRLTVSCFSPCLCLRLVCAFYEEEQKHKWRGQLAWHLFQLQQEGEPEALQQVRADRRHRVWCAIPEPSLPMPGAHVSVPAAPSVSARALLAADGDGIHAPVHSTRSPPSLLAAGQSILAHTGSVSREQDCTCERLASSRCVCVLMAPSGGDCHVASPLL